MGQPVKDIVIVGGSHAGLFAAIALAEAGFSVRVFERAGQVLSGTGAGIRVQPLMAEMLARRAGIDLSAHSTRTRFDRHLAPRWSAEGNSVVFEQAEDGQFASWGSLYRALMTRFGSSCYHLGESCIGASDVADKVEVRFASGREEIADLVVFADGIASSARRRLNPSARMLYAGYVAWRGLVEESRLSAATRNAIADARIFIVHISVMSSFTLYPAKMAPARPRRAIGASMPSGTATWRPAWL
jgi:2,6-dihydroxypyridine 3-monooxygenase